MIGDRDELRLICSRSAEREVAGAFMMQPELMDIHGVGLTDEHFVDPRFRVVFAGMASMRASRKAIDPVTLESHLRGTDELNIVGGLEGIGKVADVVTTPRHVKRHVATLKALHRRRRIVEAARLIVETGTGPVEDEAAFVNMAESTMFLATESIASSTARWVRDLVSDWFQRLVERSRRKTKLIGIPSRINALDAMLGGFQPGKLYVIAGRPSHGKSALGVRLACEASISPSLTYRSHRDAITLEPPILDEDGAVVMIKDAKGNSTGVRERKVWPSLIISLEMDSDELLTRMACSEAEIDATKVLEGRMVDDEFRRFTDAAARIHASEIMIEDASGLTIEQMGGLSRRWHREAVDPNRAKGDPGGIIIIDYLQLAAESTQFAKSGRNREQAIAHISKMCKILAKDLHVPVLLLCQLNRGVDSRADHRPQVSDLRESGSIEQDADVVMFTYREAQYHPDEADAWYTEDGGVVDAFSGKNEHGGSEFTRVPKAEYGEIVCGKQRGGKTGIVPTIWKGARTRYYGVDHKFTTL